MTIRAIVLGLLLGLFISSFTYFNDFVMKQTLMIGSFLPVSVFGVAVVLVVLVNPLLRALGPGGPLRAIEIAVVVAIALAACAYPGANFCRYFGTMAAMQPHHAQRRPAWDAQRVMSYLPGGSHLVAPGHVRDWSALVREVMAARESDSPLRAIYDLSLPDEKRVWQAAHDDPPVRPLQIQTLTGAVNRALVSDAFLGDGAPADAFEREVAGRAKLVAMMPLWVMPPPRGDHALVTGSRLEADVTTAMVTGRGDDGLIALDLVPWDKWWPTIRLWTGAALLLGLAMLCLMLVFHPQWSQRELLPYPISRFMADLTRPAEGGGVLPAVAQSRLFWIGLSIPVVLHLVNGLNAWFPDVPRIEMALDFNPLRTLFPNAARSAQANFVFKPTIMLSVVAFAFFLDRQVSFTVGVSNILFVMIGAAFVANGYAMEYDKFTPNKMNLLRFGSFVGIGLMIAYTGRRYYLDVLRAGVGLTTLTPTPRSAVWGARLGAALTLMSLGLLWTSGLSPLMAVVLVFTCILIWVVMTRIVCETGMFLMAGPFLPLGVWPALIGMDAMGPTQIILMGLAGFILVGDPKESLMAFLATGLQTVQRAGTSVGRVAPWMAVMAAIALGVSVVVTLGLQYQHGANVWDGYAYEAMPSRPFNDAATYAAGAITHGVLAESVEPGEWARLTRIKADPIAVAWTLGGIALVIAVAAARLRLPWWPIHPVIFLIWGTWGVGHLGFSFLLGWAIKTSIVRTAGLKAFAAITPLMIGVIAGELAAALGWQITGATYYFITNQVPERYVIFP
jgi:hypothetical protein